MDRLISVNDWIVAYSGLRTKGVKEISKILSVTDQTVYRWVKAGDIYLGENDGVLCAFRVIASELKDRIDE